MGDESIYHVVCFAQFSGVRWLYRDVGSNCPIERFRTPSLPETPRSNPDDFETLAAVTDGPVRIVWRSRSRIFCKPNVITLKRR